MPSTRKAEAKGRASAYRSIVKTEVSELKRLRKKARAASKAARKRR